MRSTVSSTRRVLTACATAVVVTAVALPAAVASDEVPPTTVGVLLQNPVPGFGGVPAEGRYAVVAYVSPGDDTVGDPTDRTVTLTFPTGVTVTALTRSTPGQPDVAVPVSGLTVTDTALAVPVTATAGWFADLTVNADTPAGTTLTTTATSAGLNIGSVNTVTVPALASPCATPTPSNVCTAAGTAGGPVSHVAVTRLVATITSYPTGTSLDGPGLPVDRHTFGDGTVHPGMTPGLNVPLTPDQLNVYLHAFADAHKATLQPGFLKVSTVQWDREYGLDPAGGVYAFSAEFLAQRDSALMAIGGQPPVVVPPVKPAPRHPTPIKTTAVVAG